MLAVNTLSFYDHQATDTQFNTFKTKITKK